MRFETYITYYIHKEYSGSFEDFYLLKQTILHEVAYPRCLPWATSIPSSVFTLVEVPIMECISIYYYAMRFIYIYLILYLPYVETIIEYLIDTEKRLTGSFEELLSSQTDYLPMVAT